MADASPNIFSSLNPDVNAQMMEAQRRQMMAKALLDDSMTPIQAGQNVRISPLSVLAKALNGYNGNQMAQSGNQQMAQAQAAMAQANIQGIYNATHGGMPGQQPSPQPQASDTDASNAALSQGAQQGDTGPTVSNAARLQAIKDQNGGTLPTTINGTHFPNLLRTDQNYQDLLFNEKLGLIPSGQAAEYAKAKYADLAATPEIKNNNWMGYTPQMALQAKQAQDIKSAEVERKGGNEYKNFLTGENGIVPKLPEGVNPVGAIASNGAISGGVTAIPNIADAVTPLQRATESNKITTANINGKTQPAFAGDVVNNPQTPQPSQGNATWTGSILPTQKLQALTAAVGKGDPDAHQALSSYQQWVSGKAPGQGNQVGQSQADIDANAQAAKDNQAKVAAIQQSAQARSGMENALGIVSKLRASGPGTVNANQAYAQLSNVFPGMKPGDNNNNFQLIDKYLNNSMSVAAQATGSNVSDAARDQFKHGQANVDTLNLPPLEKAIRYNLSQFDAAIAGAQFRDQAKQQAAAAGNSQPDLWAQNQWAKTYEPKVFEFNRMSPAERAQFKSSLTPDQRDDFGQKYGYAHQQGWVQ